MKVKQKTTCEHCDVHLPCSEEDHHEGCIDPLLARNIAEIEHRNRITEAAPEMYAALKTMEGVFTVNGEGFLKGKVANKIRAAIRKAETNG